MGTGARTCASELLMTPLELLLLISMSLSSNFVGAENISKHSYWVLQECVVEDVGRVVHLGSSGDKVFSLIRMRHLRLANILYKTQLPTFVTRSVRMFCCLNLRNCLHQISAF